MANGTDEVVGERRWLDDARDGDTAHMIEKKDNYRLVNTGILRKLQDD